MVVPRSFGLTDTGRARPINEDSYLADDGLGFYVVADGVGGRAKGEVASAMAVEEAYGFVCRGREALAAYYEDPGEQHLFAVRRLVESGVQMACYMVFGMAEQDPDRHGMSTTLSALLVVQPDRAVVAQVGDSRIYRLRRDAAVQITEDHTLFNYRLKKGLIRPDEADDAPGKNIITRAVGHKDYVQVDTQVIDIEPGDRLLLCSDGLHGYLKEGEVADLMAAGPRDEVARTLVDLANGRGGKDNITVLLVDVEGA